jgi:acetyl esterase/lipase
MARGSAAFRRCCRRTGRFDGTQELYATRLLKAGVPVRHRRFAGQMHGFFVMAGLPGAADALDYVTAAVAEVTRPGLEED